VLAVLAGVLAVLVGYLATLGALGYAAITHVPVAPAQRPANSPGTVWLVVGTDSREELTEQQREQLATGAAAGRRTDTIMLLYRPRSGPATLVSIPRDSLVAIPGQGENKVNAAFAFGGPTLLVETLEQETGVRIDGYAEVGFGGFAEVVDAAGGVDICVQERMDDPLAGIDLRPGCQRLNGPDALGYVRSRYLDPDGDLGRVRRQQEFLGALAERATSPTVLLNPVRAVPLVRAGGSALIVDDGTGPIDLTRFALTMRRATGPGGLAMTVPVAGFADTAVGSVVLWDDAADEVWAAMRDGEQIPRRLARAGI
jgi:LCP family protein required for cell wall assembly